MKTLKILVTTLFVLGFFFVSTNVNAQEKWGESGKYEWQVTFICPNAGEFLQGILVMHENEHGEVTHVTMKGKKLIGITIGGFDEEGNPIPSGEPSGNVYMFTRVDLYAPEKGLIIVRTVRLGDGIVTRFTAHF